MFAYGYGVGIAPNIAALDTFSPLDIAGLELWVKADAGITLSGSNVTLWADQSGNGNDLTPPAAGNRPLIATDSDGKTLVRFDGTDDYMNFTTGLSNIRTVFWVIKEDVNATDNYRPLLGDSTLYDFSRAALKILIDSGSASASVINGVTKLGGVTISPVGAYGLANTIKSVISLKTTGNVNAGNFANDRIAYGRVWDGDLYEMLIFNTAVSDADITTITTYLKNRHSLSFSQLSMEGDSFMQSYIGGYIRDGLLSSGNNSAMNNSAISGSGIGNSSSSGGIYLLETTRYNTLKARYKSGVTNIIATCEGINDLDFFLNDGMTVSQAVAQVYTDWLTYTQGLTALGFKVVINTCTPKSNVGTNANYETARQNAGNKQDVTTINGLMRSVFDVTESTRIFTSSDSDWSNVVLVDFGDDPNMGQAGDDTNATYYVDLVHPTTTGSAIISDNYYVPAIQLFL